MKTHTLLFSLLAALFFSIQHAAAQQTIELPDSLRLYRCDTLTGHWSSLQSADYWQWNAHNDIVQHDVRNWDSINTLADSRQLYTYDAAHHLTGVQSLKWAGSAWDTLTLQSYDYDVSAGLVSGSLFWFPTPWTGQGLPWLTLTSYDGDINRPLVETTLISHSGGGWDSLSRRLWGYSATTDTQMAQTWDTTTTTWLNSTMYIHSPGHLSSYNGNGTSWTFFALSDTTYDSYGHTTMITDVWTVGNHLDTVQYRHTYSYDAGGHMLTDASDYYQTGTWYNDGRDTFTYDAAGRRLTGHYTHPVFTTVDSAYTYDSLGYIDHCTRRLTTTRYYGDSIQYYYHRATATGVQSVVLTADIAVYPVPAHGQLTVAVHTAAAEDLTMTMTDMAGRKVLTGTLHDGPNHLNVEGLPDGIYLLRADDSRGASQGHRVLIY